MKEKKQKTAWEQKLEDNCLPPHWTHGVGILLLQAKPEEREELSKVLIRVKLE